MASAWCRWTASPRPWRRFRAEGRQRAATSRCPSSSMPRALAQAHLTPRAALAEAVQHAALRDDGIHGDNTDGIGLVSDIAAQCRRRAGRPRAAADRRGRRRGRRAGAADRGRPPPRRGGQPHAGQGGGAGAAPCGAGAARTASRWRRSRWTRCRAASTWSSTPRPAAWRRRRAGGGRVLQARRAGARHDVRPGRGRLHGLGARARRRAARRPGHAGRAGGRGLPGVARRAPALGRRCWPNCAPSSTTRHEGDRCAGSAAAAGRPSRCSCSSSCASRRWRRSIRNPPPSSAPRPG